MAEPTETWFFTSYAWADEPKHDSDRSVVSDFHQRVAVCLQSKVETSFDQNGFLDVWALDAGESWQAALVQALHQCRTFLPLLTPRYFTRGACKKEWAAFHARASGTKNPRDLMIPVLWAAEDDIKPKLVGQWVETWLIPNDRHFQSERERAYLTAYKRLGLSALMRLAAASDRDASAAVSHLADVFARMIKERGMQAPLEATEGALPPWDAIPLEPLEKLLKPLRATHPAVHVAVAAGSADEMQETRDVQYYPGDDRDWLPFGTGKPKANEVITEAVSQVGCVTKWLNARADLTLPIRRLEADGCQPAIVLIDAWAVEIEAFNATLEAYERQKFLNTVEILVLNHEGALDSAACVALEAKINALFLRNKGVKRVSDIGTLREVLLRSIKDIREMAATQRSRTRDVEPGGPLPLVRN